MSSRLGSFRYFRQVHWVKCMGLIWTLTGAGNQALAFNAPIIGGKIVAQNDFIAHTVVALVARSSKSEALCTASLVASDLAITAAHCVSDPGSTEPALFSLLFNRNIHQADSNQLRTVDRVEIPAEWKTQNARENDTSDVALLHFTGGLPKDYVASDLLPIEQVLSVGNSVVLAGYGINDANLDSGAGILRKTKVSILNPHFSPSEVELDQSQGGGACHGDSGGPAYLILNGHAYLFGITSRGGGKCDQEVIYTQIAAYRDWFEQAVALIRK